MVHGCSGGGGGVFVCDGCSCVSDPRCIQFTLGSCYAMHTNALPIMKGYIERNNMQVE